MRQRIEMWFAHGRGPLGAILCLYLLLGFTYSIVVPLAETPDESEHFRYLQYIANSGDLPVMVPVYEENVTIEAHQPPLHYLVGAGLTRWLGLDDLNTADNPPANSCFSFEPDDPGRKNAYLHTAAEWPPQKDLYRAFMLMRWLSVVMGALTVALAYRLGRQVYPADARVAVIAAGLLAFNPQFIFITSSLNNDVPTTLIGAAVVSFAITAIAKPQVRYFVILGILIGLGILTKFATLALWPIAMLAAGWPLVLYAHGRVWPSAKAVPFPSWRSFTLPISLVLSLPMLVAGWWYWRNFQLYGDPLMWEVTLAAKGAVIARDGALTLADLWHFVWFHFQSYWLWFGWLNIKAPGWVYAVLTVVVFTAVLGLGRMLWQWRQHPQINWIALGVLSLAPAGIYASLLQYIQTINWTGYQGRLAFAAAAPLAVLLALGLRELWGTRASLGLTGGLLVLATTAVPLILWPAYPRPDIYQPPLDNARTCLRFASGLQVEAVAVPEETTPAGTLPVTVYGYGLADTADSHSLTVRLRGRDGRIVAENSQALSWAAREVLSTTLDLPVAADAQPVRGTLEVGLRDEAGGWQAATSATGRVLDVPLGITAVKVAPREPFQPQPQVTVTNAYFGGQLQLIGYDWRMAEEQILITLYWQAIAPISRDYTTFVHAQAADGTIVAQNDAQPQDGQYPTSVWRVGEIVADTKQLPLTAWPSEPEGQLLVGAYEWATLERLSVTDEVGEPWPDAVYPLPR